MTTNFLKFSIHTGDGKFKAATNTGGKSNMLQRQMTSAEMQTALERLANADKTAAEIIGSGIHDAVNHPKYYTSDPSGVECIQITRHRNFNIGNAIKYLWRNGLKDSDAQIQDLEKAVWYINDEIKRLKRGKP